MVLLRLPTGNTVLSREIWIAPNLFYTIQYLWLVCSVQNIHVWNIWSTIFISDIHDTQYYVWYVLSMMQNIYLYIYWSRLCLLVTVTARNLLITSHDPYMSWSRTGIRTKSDRDRLKFNLKTVTSIRWHEEKQIYTNQIIYTYNDTGIAKVTSHFYDFIAQLKKLWLITIRNRNLGVISYLSNADHYCPYCSSLVQSILHQLLSRTRNVDITARILCRDWFMRKTVDSWTVCVISLFRVRITFFSIFYFLRLFFPSAPLSSLIFLFSIRKR